MQHHGRADGAVNVQDFLNEHRFSPYQWLIFGLCFVIVLLDGFDTAAIGFIAPSLVQDWGVTRPALAPVLSAALFGLAAGAMAAGPLSDRVGRKLVLALSVLLFGAACAWSAFASGVTELAILRFITGLGLGAAMPNAVTLMSEFCPDRKRALLTNAMFCGFPLGAALGGFLAAWMIPLWGWRSVLLLGGLAPLLAGLLIILLLPESVRFLVARGAGHERIRAILRHVSPSADAAHAFVTREAAPADQAGGGMQVILSRPYVVGTLMLWLTYFMGLVIFYALINWMPLLLRDAGLSAKDATLVSALFPLGGVGAVLAGWLMDRYNANAVIAACFALTAATIFAIGQSAHDLALLMAVVLGAGLAMNTAQASLPALAAAFYPTRGRATGVAWMMGIGRLGGIAGSFLVAELARLRFGIEGIFGVVALAGIVATLALLVKLAAERAGKQPA
ncbi:MFS transporter [Massilia timonae]|uniref:Sugar (And other) transporter family protein n=1 Tax=Massilia timonae TaxID=47229 RepID=A0A1S2N6Y4_9BURK|nr:MFS transporter [Massilia timonae]OIJ40847.1 sugar (and other) transporter family protein [Massilia timonae]